MLAAPTLNLKDKLHPLYLQAETAQVVGDADHLVRMRPLGPEETELQAEWLFKPETLNSGAYDMANVVDFGKLVMEQDAKACELNQQGLHAAPLEQGVLMPEEYILHRFHQWVREGVAGG